MIDKKMSYINGEVSQLAKSQRLGSLYWKGLRKKRVKSVLQTKPILRN